jgi:hypothetical protein
MSEAARVTSIDALRDWKETLCVFRADAQEALTAVEMDIRRTQDWLDSQTSYWQNEVRRREELVLQAKAELTRRKMLPIIGKHPDTTEQEKNLKRALQRLDEAEAKVAKARQLAPVLRRALDEYEGPARRLGGMLDGDLPRALAVLDRKIEALDAYVGLSASASTQRPETPPEPKADDDKAEA